MTHPRYTRLGIVNLPALGRRVFRGRIITGPSLPPVRGEETPARPVPHPGEPCTFVTVPGTVGVSGAPLAACRCGEVGYRV